jgi:hypothetical protein
MMRENKYFKCKKLKFSPKQIRKYRAQFKEIEYIILIIFNFKFLLPDGKRPLWRHKRSWEGMSKINTKYIGYEGVDWIDLAQDKEKRRALLNKGMNLRVP